MCEVYIQLCVISVELETNTRMIGLLNPPVDLYHSTNPYIRIRCSMNQP